MSIRNYTSSQAVDRSLTFIEQKLSAFGVSQIMKTYDKQTKQLSALHFMLDVNGRAVPVLLPAKIAACEKRLISDYVQSHSKPMSDGAKETIKLQAERTAWKLAAEWLDIQLTMVALDQKELLEVFIADVWDPATASTYYARLKSTGFKHLQLPARAET